MSRGLVTLLHLLTVFLCVRASFSASLSVSNPLAASLQDLWQDVALRAAEATVRAVSKQIGMHMSLRDVHMDTFRVQLGRQHHIGLEIEGTNYELVLGNELDAAQGEESKHALTEEGSSHKVSRTSLRSTTSPTYYGTSPVEQHTLLPDLTLAGPLEIILPAQTQISAQLPNVADVGTARRIFICEGATAMIRGLKDLALRYPIELPPLPAQYLAEVYATLQLGTPEPGFRSAPAILYMSQQLFRAAANSSQLLKRPLISLEADTSPGGVSIIAAAEQPGQVPPRLKAKKLKDGTLEFSTRPGQVEVQEGLPLPGLPSRLWAWPLPAVDMDRWLPYETVLRGLLAQHPFNAQALQEKGTVSLRLTKSKMVGVKHVQFDMEVLGQLPPEFARPKDLEELTGEQEAPPLEVWEVVVQVDAKKDGQLKLTPLIARQKVSYQDTFSLSPATIRLQTYGNHSLPLGYESSSLGIAEAP